MQLADESGASVEGVGATGRTVSTSGWRESSHDALREQLAALCHEQWSGWMKYLFGRCQWIDNQSRLISKDDFEWWLSLTKMRYDELNEVSKNSDRREADRILEILGK